MRTRDVVVGLVILIVLVTTAVVYKKAKTDKLQDLPLSTSGIEQKISNTFNGFTIPVDADKAELKDVSGEDGFGIATRTEILADLAEPESGFYQAWLEKDGKRVLLGAMRIAKGGYITEYNGANYPGYDKVIVTLGEESVLEGSF
ncbi:MAG: hypothetical protein UX13_C0018G0002 [Candidatus Woesebacteria bacterium GW2011_GWB1_45_5]|uniref:Anti-sigma factor n=1 Tax=Candidatus Woesebacteria bacterium GW2011_GWB1_45_5 TaxID=1618581 RepID=A0A0G1PXL6_9BACT|nr:MAG: hypothetical protein UX13_C0018G0002 [Candidatus Woesebacteria bacterium GW2011_GWB1_45_5]